MVVRPSNSVVDRRSVRTSGTYRREVQPFASGTQLTLNSNPSNEMFPRGPNPWLLERVGVVEWTVT